MVTPPRASAKLTIATKTKRRRFSRARGIRAVLGEKASEKSGGIFSKLFHQRRIVRPRASKPSGHRHRYLRP